MEETARQFTNPFSGETRSVPEGVVLREGRSDDQERINELCREVNFVSGWDFMPGLWVTWMNSPDTTIVVVAEAGGKLVSVAGLLVANKGKHFISFGSRSSPTVRGKNVFWACCAHKITLGIQRYGCPEKFMTVACNFQIAQKTREGGRMNYKAVGYKACMFVGHPMNAADIQIMTDYLTSDVQTHDDVSILKTADELAQLFGDNDTNFALFPEGYVKVMYAVYEAIPQTAYDVWDPDIRMFAVSRNSNHCVTSFSVMTMMSHSFHGRAGSTVQFEVYGDNGVDAVMSHLRVHMPNFWQAHEKWGGEMFLLMEINAHCNKEALIEEFRDKMKLTCVPGDFDVMLCYDKPELHQTQNM